MRVIRGLQAVRDELAEHYRRRIEHLLLGARVQRQRFSEALVLGKPRGARGDAQLLQRADDLPMFGQHLRQLGLEALGERQDLGHLRPHAVLGQLGEQR